MRVSWALRLFGMGVLLAGAIGAPAAQARRAATPAIVVNFFATGVVNVTLNGAPLGTTSGPPTVIPAGNYLLVLNGPADCINLPLFELSGPGVDIQDDMMGGEVDTHTIPISFAPSSTYTWHLDRTQSIVYTFQTSSAVVGSPSAATSTTAASSTTASSGSGGAVANDVVGSAIVASRGTLTGVVTAAGRLTLDYRGKGVTSLKAGRYTLDVVDRSASSGFVVKGKRTESVTGTAFVGRRSVTLTLTAGRWSFGPSAAKSTYTVSVSA